MRAVLSRGRVAWLPRSVNAENAVLINRMVSDFPLRRSTSSAVAGPQHGPNLCFRTFNRCMSAAPPKTNPDGTTPFLLADIGEGIKECEIIQWFIKEGDTIAQFDLVCEVQSDKANVEISSRYDGVVTKLYYEVGAMAQVGDPLIDIRMEGSTAPPVEASKPVSESPSSPTPSPAAAPPLSEKAHYGKALAVPSVRRIAKENNVNLADVVGTGKDGRVLKEDILSFLSRGSSGAVAVAETSAMVAGPVVPLAGDKELPVRGLTRTMIKTMTASAAVPHFGYKDEVRMDALIELRSLLKEDMLSHGVKFSYLPLLLKAMSVALTQYPQLNASLKPDLSAIVHKARHNIGVAMDTPGGLLVPNVKNVQNMSVLDIARELTRLQTAAAANKLSTADLTDGTITLSNIGTVGGTYATPVLLLPEVAICAIGKMQAIPRYNQHGDIEKATMMCMSFSADHRVLDGVTVAKFSNLWRKFIENPATLMPYLK